MPVLLTFIIQPSKCTIFLLNPRIASLKDISNFVYKSSPFLSKLASGVILIVTSTSPGKAFTIESPSPLNVIVWLSLIPFSIYTLNDLFSDTVLWPWQ